jgi:hypothetical protein
MILGRPTNLWLGLATAALLTLQVVLVTAGFDAVAVATILGSVGGLIGALIALVSGQPPTLNPGDTFKIVTPPGQENYSATVATPPAPSPASPTPPGG